jgi:hypothetical protein
MDDTIVTTLPEGLISFDDLTGATASFALNRKEFYG